MDTSKSTAIVCRCNECGNLISAELNIFSLNGKGVKAKCAMCGEGEFEAEMTRTRGVNLKVPCVYCRGEHRYPLSSPVFFGRELFKLQCPLTGYDSCLIGTDEQKLDEAVEQNESELKQLVMEAQNMDEVRSSFENGEGNGENLAKAFEEIISAVNTFVADKRYACECEKLPSPSELCMTVDGVCIEIKCKICGAAETVNVSDPDDVERFVDGGMIDMWK